MKTWKNAAIEELNLNETAGGGTRSTKHDGEWISVELPNGKKSWWEGTYPVSGHVGADD